MSALHMLHRLTSGRLIFVGPLALLAAVPVIAPRPDGRIATMALIAEQVADAR